MTHAPAGWYSDPTISAAHLPALRYWDGARWTEHVAPLPVARPAAVAAYTAARPTTPDGVPLAGWGWRVLAHLVDVMIIGTVVSLVTLPQQIAVQARIMEMAEKAEDTAVGLGEFWVELLEVLRDLMIWQLPVVVLTATYYAVMLRWKGGTVGKLAVGLRVRLRSRPGRLPWSAIAVRVLVINLLTSVPVALFVGGWWAAALWAWVAVSVFGLLDALWPLWDRKRQALHDKLARTNVVTVR